ncbi:crotonase/enoyl-CoA hydratase family protein [soil metagenome]
MSERITFTLDDDGVGHVRLARPDKMNALDGAMFDALIGISERLATLRGLRAVVIAGEGRAFCAGLDMASFGRMSEPGDSAAGSVADPSAPKSVDVTDLVPRTHGLANKPQQVAWAWRELPVPVIAAVHGVAFGGGLQIALGADVRLVTADLKMSVMEIKWGLVPDMAGIPLMRSLARDDVVRELTYTGRVFSGAEALAIGFATRVCEDPLAAAIEMARGIAGRSPDAIRADKRLFNQSHTGTDAELMMAESVEQQRIIGSPNQTEAVRAAMEKRAPVFVD